jgi:hypothetical protein
MPQCLAQPPTPSDSSNDAIPREVEQRESIPKMLHSLTRRQGHSTESSIKERNFDSNTSGSRYPRNNAFTAPIYTTWDPESPLHKFRDLWQSEAPSLGNNGSKDSQPSTPYTTSHAELYDEDEDLADICREGWLQFVGNWSESGPIAVAVASESIRDDNDEIYTPVGSPRSSPRQIDGPYWPPSPSLSSA